MEPLTKQDKDQIVYLVTHQYRRVAEVAKTFSKSRQAIYDVLKQYGVDIKDYIWITVECEYCRKAFKKRRHMIRTSKLDFCCNEHQSMWKREKKNAGE